MARMSSNGLVIYRGKSNLPGQENLDIVAVLTGIDKPSCNEKTGPMMQLWILVDDIDPISAMYADIDRAVCGDCPMRKGVCYVNVAQAPLSVWKALQAWKYRNLDCATDKQLKAMKRQSVRLGAYGDPAALPLEVISNLVHMCNGHTGFTHQWKHHCANGLQYYCMASVETELDMCLAHAYGWKTFRVRDTANPTILPNEIECLNSSCGIQCSTCQTCKGCDGTNISITVHGPKNKVNNFSKR